MKCIPIIGGTTYHTGLDIFPDNEEYVSLTNEKMAQLQSLYSDVNVMIFDEMSMLGAGRLYDIHHRWQDIKISRDLFGGICSLLIGDLMQLKPVYSQEVYKKPKTLQNAALWASEDNLWNNAKVVVLKTNFRQGVSEWTNTLNRIRVGQVTQEDINLLESRRIRNFPRKDLSRATHLFRTNREVYDHNVKVINSLNTTSMFKRAEIESPKGFYPKVDQDSGFIEKTGFMDCLVLKIGLRVMIISNIDIPDGLVNGSIGEGKF